MRYGAWMIGAAALITTACGGEEAPQTAQTEQPAGAQVTALPQDVIDRLKERYAVLREEAAPEPQPGADANPSIIPPRVQEKVPQMSLQVVTGDATFYANRFEGRRTASGIPFRQNQMVAAHRAFPFGTLLRVTNTRNNRSVNVRVVDRGPFGTGAKARRTVIDLSRRAAEQLDFIDAGRASVRVEVLQWGSGLPSA